MPTWSDAAPQDESHHVGPPENRSTMTAYQKLVQSPSATPRASSDLRIPDLSRTLGHFRKVPEGDIGQGLKSCIRCGNLLNERLKSNDDFGCSLTVASDKIEQLSDFLQIWRFSAQPV